MNEIISGGSQAVLWIIGHNLMEMSVTKVTLSISVTINAFKFGIGMMEKKL